MRSKSWVSLLIAALAGLALLTGCVRRTAPSTSTPVAASTDAATSAVAFLDKTFAVAPFTIPGTDADLLSGYLPANHLVPELVPARLDAVLDAVISGLSHKFVPANVVAACAKTASRGTESGRLATLKYWQNVGMCAGADYVLVPLALYWRDRDGSAAGSTKAASVDLSLYLVDVRTGGVVKHFHFEETQKALTDNLLEADKFVSRHGRWLTAQELAQEGLSKGVRELGL
jgi:hypothetical protein